jgi:hypothetical protein
VGDSLGVSLEGAPPGHSTVSRKRRLVDLETHRTVFTWVLAVPEYGRLGEGQDDRYRRHDARSERDIALHRATVVKFCDILGVTPMRDRTLTQQAPGVVGACASERRRSAPGVDMASGSDRNVAA